MAVGSVSSLGSETASLSGDRCLFLTVFLRRCGGSLGGCVRSFGGVPSLMDVSGCGGTGLMRLVSFFSSFPLLFGNREVGPAWLEATDVLRTRGAKDHVGANFPLFLPCSGSLRVWRGCWAFGYFL